MALSEITKITGPGIHTLSNVLSHNIKSSGIITATKFSGPLDSIGGNFAGVITATSANFSGNVTIGGTLTYEDVTNIDSVGIITANQGIHVGAGVSAVGVGTFGSLDIGGDIDVDGHTNLDNVSVAGVTTFSDTVHVGTAVTVLGNGNAIFSGITTFNLGVNIPFYKSLIIGSSLYGKISYPTGGSALEIQALNQIKMKCWDGNSHETGFLISGVSGLTRLGGGTMGNNGSRQPRLDVYGNTTQAITMSSSDGSNLTERFKLSQGGFNFTGLSTHTGNFDLDGDLDVDGHTNLDNVSIAGVVTATSFVGSGANLTSLPAQATIANNADNRVITGGSGVNLNGEANLTYNGSILHNQISAGARNDFSTSADGLIIEKGGNTGLSIDPGSSGVANIYFPNESNHSIASISHNNSNGELRVRGEDHIILSTNNNTERLRITSTGEVLIGATTGGNGDTDDLIVSGSGKRGMTVCSTNGSECSLTFADGLSGVNAVAGSVKYTHSNDSLDLYTATTRRLRIDSSGRLLINTTTATGAAKLQLLQSSGDGLLVRNHDTNYEGIILSNESGQARLMATSGGSTARPALTFFAGDAERMRIQTNGYMGLNTSGAQRLFSVKETNNKASIHIWRTSETNGDYSGIDFSGHPSNNGTNYQKGGIYWQTDGSGFGRGDMVFCNDEAANADNVVIGDEKMRIHKEGYVTKPNTVAFRATHAGNQSLSSNDTITTWSTTNSLRGHATGGASISSGVFTAPVTGVYVFHAQFLLQGATNTTGIHLVWKKNNQTFTYFNSRYNGNQIGYGGYVPVCGQTTMHLDANENCRITISFGGTAPSVYGTDYNWGFWDGYLLG